MKSHKCCGAFPKNVFGGWGPSPDEGRDLVDNRGGTETSTGAKAPPAAGKTHISGVAGSLPVAPEFLDSSDSETFIVGEGFTTLKQEQITKSVLH